MELRRRLTPWGVWASHLGLLPIEASRAGAVEIERLGYGCLWVGEAEGKEALTHAALLLAATERCVVATGIANIWVRDPMATVNGARTLAEAHPGRFVLGLGASHPALLERRGQRYDRPLAAMAEHLDAMDAAPWRGPALTEEPARVLAALGPRMARLAAERSAGVHTFLVTPEHTRRVRGHVGPDRLVAPEQAVVVADRRADARAAADRHLAGYLALPNYRRNLERLGWDLAVHAAAQVSDELFDALIAWGDAAEVAARLAAHHDAGADHVALHPLTREVGDGPLPTLRELGPALGPTLGTATALEQAAIRRSGRLAARAGARFLAVVVNRADVACVYQQARVREREASMQRTVMVLVITALVVLGLAPAASAQQNQPGNGESSTTRNDAGFGGGPHCHLLVVDSAQDQFEHIRVFPSHTGHVNSGVEDGVFIADADCDGLPPES